MTRHEFKKEKIRKLKEADEKTCPEKTTEMVVHGVVKEVPRKEYVKWLEDRLDYYRERCCEGEI